MQEPICGWPWYRRHYADYTQQEIDSLSIQVRVSGKLQAEVRASEKKDRGIIKEVIKLNK